MKVLGKQVTVEEGMNTISTCRPAGMTYSTHLPRRTHAMVHVCEISLGDEDFDRFHVVGQDKRFFNFNRF